MLLPTIADMLPSAIAVAASPAPIVAIVLMLGTPQAARNGTAMALGWVGGLAVICAAVLLTGDVGDTSDTAPSTVGSWVQIVLGALLVGVAVKLWLSRSDDEKEPALPSWMATIDHFGPAKSLGVGLLGSVGNLKNLPLTVAAMTTVTQSDLSTGAAVVAAAVFLALASVTVVGPLAVYLVRRERAAATLAGIKDFMAAHNAAIMMVLALVFGVKLLGGGVSALIGR